MFQSLLKPTIEATNEQITIWIPYLITWT